MYSKGPLEIPQNPQLCSKKKMKKMKLKLKSKAQPAKVFKDFCESTSLHGYSYLYIATSTLMKIIWIVWIVIASALGIGFVVSNTNDYLGAKIVTTIESSSAPLDVSFIEGFNQ